MKKLMIASDHGGWDLKEKIKAHFTDVEWIDLGPSSEQTSVDYPDFADALCLRMQQDSQEQQGILICGSGQGMAMRANKFPGVRAALVWNEEITQLAREHNNANVLCLGGRVLSLETALSCVGVFLKTSFAGGRHQQRIEKLHKPISSTSHQ